MQNEFSPNAIRVMESRYLQKDENGLKESPRQLFKRVAKAVAKAELIWRSEPECQRWEDKFFGSMQPIAFSSPLTHLNERRHPF